MSPSKVFKNQVRSLLGRWWKLSRLLGTGAGIFLGVFLMTLLSQMALGTLSLSQGQTRSSFLVVSNPQGVDSEKLKELGDKSFVLKIAPLRSATFTVFASVPFGGGQYGSEIFLEALPKEFLDSLPPEWGWTVGQAEVPIIITREFLALYNHGFAPTRGLPRIAEENVSLLALDLRITGRRKSLGFKARIVGFTDRVSSILVPQEFLKWGNANLGDREEKVGRVMIEVSDPGDPQIAPFLTLGGWEVNQERLLPSQWAAAAQLILFIVWILAAIALIGGFFLAQWSLGLTLIESKADRELLWVLGFSRELTWNLFIQTPVAVSLVSAIAGLTGGVLLHMPIAQFFAQWNLPYGETWWVAPILLVVLGGLGFFIYRPPKGSGR